MSAPESPAMAIVWLASYPKSGNTWLRAVLTNYLHPRGDGEPAPIDALIGDWAGSDREAFGEITGVDASEMAPDEIARHLPAFRELLAGDLPEPAFVKTHDAHRGADDAPRFPRAGTAGVVYLIRSPLDVAVSYAHHRQEPVGEIVRRMNDPAAAESHVPGGICGRLPEPLTTWSGHVASWLDQRELPLHAARYEDLLADPRTAFGAIVRFAGLDFDAALLDRAIERSAFTRLRAQEIRSGFRERMPSAPSFFRSGTAGSWRTALTPGQVRALVDAHGPVMARLGYLRDAEAPAADGGRKRAHAP